MVHIEDLPVEVLCMIFDRVDDVKHAAVVCRRWNEILFHSPYVNRFRMVLDTESMVSAMENQHRNQRTLQLQRKLLEEATASNRWYRRVMWIANKRTLQDHSWILDRIVPPATRLVQLQLNYDSVTTIDLMPALANALPNLHRLRILMLLENEWNYDRAGPLVTLTSASVERLELSQYHGYRLRVKMPNLLSFRGQLCCYPDERSLDPFAFFDECHAKLTAIHLEFYSMRSAIHSTIDQLPFFPRLEKISFAYFGMGDEELETVLAALAPPRVQLRSIGFYACFLTQHKIARIHACLPSTVRKVIVPALMSNPRPGSPFRD